MLMSDITWQEWLLKALSAFFNLKPFCRVHIAPALQSWMKIDIFSIYRCKKLGREWRWLARAWKPGSQQFLGSWSAADSLACCSVFISIHLRFTVDTNELKYTRKQITSHRHYGVTLSTYSQFNLQAIPLFKYVAKWFLNYT